MPETHSGAESRERAASKDLLAWNLSACSAEDFLLHLRSMDVELRVRNGKLALNAPAGVVTAELQQLLRSRKTELMEELMRRELAEERVAPLTYAQQRLWLIDRFDPQSAVYNIPQAWMVKGVVEDGIFRRALAMLADRHGALRTRIELRGGEPMQVVLRSVEIPCQITNLCALCDEREERAEIQAALQRMGHEAFALDRAPLIRFQLLYLSKQRTVVAYNVHHIVADQRSLDILRREIEALYLEAAGRMPSRLPLQELSYAQVAERERSAKTQRMHQEQVNYWKERLAGMPSLLELPFAKNSSATQSQAGATVRLRMGEGLTANLRMFATRANTSLFMTALSAFAALVYRYTGQSDFCIGTPLTGRKRREEEELIGLFVNMLPIRSRVRGDEEFLRLAQRFSAEMLLDLEHGDAPFQRLVTELHPQRALSRSPFFQLMFALTPKNADGDDELEETLLAVSKFDLTFQLVERSQWIDLYLEFRTNLYEAEDIEQFGKHYVALLEELVASPNAKIDALPLLTAQDKKIFAEWNKTEISLDRSLTLADLFQLQAELTPDAIALRWKDKAISYRELNEEAESMARSLRAYGVAAETFVGVCLPRTPVLIVALLAIHKTGAAYLPLDPKYPVERLKYMVEDSGAGVLVAERGSLSEALGKHCPGLQILYGPGESAGDVRPRQERARPGNAAYLIYTSGSTGKPKGVVVEHRNAVALIAWAKEYFDSDAYKGMLASTSVCFDLSIFEIFLPLATGKMIVLMEDVLEVSTSPIAESVTLVNTVPSAMSALLQAGLPKSVTTVCLAGEYLSAELVDKIYDAGVKQIFDLYGPTETTTYSTCVLRKPGVAANLGGPIGNTRIYLLDERRKQTPPGAVGEIYIGGEGVTRGYLGRPELTSERFVCLPEIDARGTFYKTGDLARYRRDGALIFIGRRDHQVKLRGYRIELGEIEAALREVSGLTEVAAVVRGDVLVAYVEADAAAGVWMERLRERLPSYMIPSSIIALAALPRTPNGKIDRQALRLRIEIVENMDDNDATSRDRLEEQLAKIWARRLGLSRVGRNAHFFEELGGHSLAAFEIFAEIESSLGMPMMLATLFQAPTVAQLATVMRRQGWRE
ncbi:MAG TPA: amino acid adenylation domain-containing protein [Acidobacteriaceae bacterium]